MLLRAERLFHLEQLAECEGDDEARDHRFAARLWKHFLETVPEKVEIAYQHMETEARGEGDVTSFEGGSPYMEGDETPAKGSES